ncbi:hypothetical protein EDF57_101888 [Novosphingobium sp. PhB55]|uniref:hypothetical protein n=1 Tax=Novosphingobium sp. PhB55 TaxID=2485106 RepID=UPI001064B11D|nr:hypothetical protein [Novosphingobium sp. PhB55]TDW68994.1 hypothetical protein EDF57_101888 [Novosphingobium sp. PhB55]
MVIIHATAYGIVIFVPATGFAQSSNTEISSATEDAETSFRSARIAAETGDFFGAIADLERVLQTNPDLANVKLELGLLYLRVGNPDLARSYLKLAINAPDAPFEARTRADQALRSASGALGRLSLSGSGYASGMFQTNPNGSPSAVSIVGAGGVPVLISGDDLSIPRGSDVSANMGGSLELRYGLGGQQGNDLTANLAAGYVGYADAQELNAFYMNGQFGPRFFFGRADPTSGYLRPYGTSTFLRLGGARYFSANGAGLAVFARAGLAVSLTAQIGWEARDYYNSRLRPTAAEQEGDYWSGIAEGAVSLSPRTRLSAAFLFEAVDARRAYWTRTTFGGQVGLTHAIAPPVGQTSWLGRLTATYRHSGYDAADPLVDPEVVRKEDRIELEASLSIPVTSALAVELRGSQTWNQANLPNYEYDNSLVSLGMSCRF